MGNCPKKGQSNTAILETPPEPTMLDCHRHMVVSIYDYPSHSLSGSSIHFGERLTVISDDGDYLMVKSTTTGQEFYIPSNYTAKVINRWQFTGISRLKAEELLFLPHNQTGAFMVRESQTNTESYSLSVLDQGPNSSYQGSVKHYRICRLQNSWFYISPSLTFPSLHQLIEHYSESADGLCSVLREPCFIQGSNNVPEVTRPQPIAIRRPTINWRDVSSSMIFNKGRADSGNSPVSEGLREAISSYLYMTETSCEDCGRLCDT